MTGRLPVSPFRVFGSPFTVQLHQHVTFLRLKQLPFRVYCTSFTTTLLYSIYYRARSVFCTLTPSGASPLQVWQLAESTELDVDVEAVARTAKGEVEYCPNHPAGTRSSSDVVGPATAGAAAARTQRMLLHRATHPQLHLASWCVVVYACWWLARTGAMFRYFRSDSTELLEGHVRYFLFIPNPGFARPLAPQFRNAMQQVVAVTGASEVTSPYIEEHFNRFCAALDAHLRQHPGEPFLLGTPHPTLADVTLGAAFSSFFLMDNPPAAMLADKFPSLTEYVERVTGWRGATYVDAAAPAGEGSERAPANGAAATGDFPDTVPESLAPCFELVAEVFPFLMSQCASFNAFMAGDGIRTLRREPLQREWKGCEGYLLPQLTSIRSLMIVDDNVSTVRSRAQDLEVVFLAAREVFDDTLSDFGRTEAVTTPDSNAGAAVSEPLTSARVLASSQAMEGGAAPALRGAFDGAADSTLATHDSSDAEAATGSVHVTAEEEAQMIAEAAQFRTPLDLATMRLEEADFYRAYTSASRHSVAGVASSLSEVVAGTRQEGTTSPVVRSSVAAPLQTLRAMLSKMSCPQYTLTSLHHGRRIYVAVIPEHEVAKRRKARQQAASSARKPSSDSSSVTV